jgi:type IV pilus assembly protein PilM
MAVRNFLQIGAVGLGIDVGKASIKAVEVRRTSKGLEVTRLGQHPTPDGAVEGGIILDRSVVAQAVLSLLAAADIRRRRAVISVTGQNVLARVLRLPPIPEDELKQAIKWEAERHLPIPVDEAVIDVQLVREVTDDGQRQIEVLLAAAPEGLVMSYIDMLEAARIFVDAVEIGALAVTRALRTQVARGTHAVIELGASTTCVSIVADGIPQFSRTVPLGVSRPSTGSGRTDVGSGRTDVGSGRTDVGSGRTDVVSGRTDVAEEGAAAGYATLGGLTVQLRRSLDYYRAQFGGASIDDLILCGGGAGIPDIAEALSGELEIPAAVASPFVGLLVPSALEAASSGPAGAQFTVAVGLALRGMV